MYIEISERSGRTMHVDQAAARYCVKDSRMRTMESGPLEHDTVSRFERPDPEAQHEVDERFEPLV